MVETRNKSTKPYRKIGIIGDALAPHFNSAPANQMRLLSQQLGTQVLTGNNLGLLPFKKMGNYLIINIRFLRKRTPLLSSINGAIFYPIVKLFERRFDILCLAGGIDSGFLRILDLKKCILIINSLPFSNDDEVARNFSRKLAPELRAIIAQSHRIKERLVSMGIDTEKVHLIYPWIDSAKFEYNQPPDGDEFTILFASAPDAESEREDYFTEKGVGLLLESFAEFIKHHKASLCLLWRWKYNQTLYKKIEELNLESQVEVINRVVDTPSLYARAHVTVIPFLSMKAGPEIPLSAVESLVCGRPVVTTDVLEIAEIVRQYGCGCVTSPKREDFVSALMECKKNYSTYQANCRVIEQLFTLDLERLSEIMPFLG